MLTTKGTPASGWSVNFYSFQAAASDRGRVVDDIKTNNKYLIVNSEDFNYRFSQLESALNNQKNSIPALEKEVKALDKQMVAAQKAADAYWGKDANGKQMTREDAFKKFTNSVMSLINRTIARLSRLNMTKRFINRRLWHVINRVQSVMKCQFSRSEISISTNNGDRLFCNHKNLAVNCRMTG